MSTIACLSPYTEQYVRELAGTDDVTVLLVPEPPAPEAVADAVAEADIVIADTRQRHRLDRSMLEKMNRCRLIQQPAVGFNAIDHRAAAECGIPVANATSYNREAVADLAILGLLNLLRHAAAGDRDMRTGGWSRRTGRELGSLTVGIVGMGNIGSAVLTRLRAFGCRILFHDIAVRGVSGAQAVPLGELLARSDAVTVHTPLDETTRGLLSTPEFDRIKPGALLVNTSRGPVVDEAALVAALQSGRLGGAALDVFEVEPLAADSPLRRMDNVFLTPHIGGDTEEAQVRLRDAVATNIRRALARRDPLNVVNNSTSRR
ncbi:hydroxyacid dehydrogenase [Saccharopolyspora sp. K220]|uniref:2-hydroxyacid dehydrogenase n=1 Tax=Saccharopolyspora soli TaxID=2926618 RepID=UPI001F5AD876|nr:NAD(P)-dependent oxidoreductase [Saccharopolyspora soli]MCI2420280.1 hydroxyacid dehydrogenase [Saccharopolyspora soli]